MFKKTNNLFCLFQLRNMKVVCDYVFVVVQQLFIYYFILYETNEIQSLAIMN